MRHVDLYLRIPPSDLGWTVDGTAIARGDGTTFAVAEEVLSFLEGFALGRRLIPFGDLLLCLGLIWGRWGPAPGMSLELDRLRAAFRATGCRVRNAGAFFADLFAMWPAAPGAPTVEEIGRRFFADDRHTLRPNTMALPEMTDGTGETQLVAVVTRRLYDLDREELEGWLRDGSTPRFAAGEDLASALDSRPAHSLEGLLGKEIDRPRLAGATSLIEQLGAALTLPPRKLAQSGLPLGGYSDITTSGHPDRLLPSQFALDELELLRRFAERELLYYRREEPRAGLREEMVILIDQGVRTWGTPRLVLLAAAFALTRLAERRKLVLRLATTGQPEPWSPAEQTPEELANRLERCDLSASPESMLGLALESPATLPRDVVLLTHPRNLEALTAPVPEGTRLFALTVDREGAAVLGEMHEGRCVPIQAFRVEVGSPAPPVRRSAPASRRPWTGAVEPNACLFLVHPGPGKPTHFCFDEDERNLLLSLADGYLMLVPLHGPPELLPRSLAGQIHGIYGEVGGFAVSGEHFGVHYDVTTRDVSPHQSVELPPPGELRVVRNHAPRNREISVDAGGLLMWVAGDQHFSGQPLEDGLPALSGAQLLRAQEFNSVLALDVHLPGGHGRAMGEYLLVYDGECRLLLQTRINTKEPWWTLSPSGKYVAFGGSYPGQVEIRETDPTSRRRQGTPRYREPGRCEPKLGKGWLSLVSHRVHLIRWDGARLVIESATVPRRQSNEWYLNRLATLGLDPDSASRKLRLETILPGVIAILDADGVCVVQVCVRGSKLALATPDGHRWGDAGLLGQAPTHDAGLVIAERLRTAEGRS